MTKILCACIAMTIAINLFAQTSVERVFILNEGYFDFFSGEIVTPVTLAAYDPETGTYTVLDEIVNARFASDIKVDDAYYFVAADKYLLKYDRFTDALLQSIEVEGIRKIAFDNNYLVVTRGEYLVSLPSYIQVYDKNTLELVFEIPAAELNYSAEGVLIQDGFAYVAVNNGFDFGNEVGMIEKIDLTAQSITETIDLGADGKNPDNIMLDGDNIYTLNNKDYTGSSVSSYNLSSGTISTANLLNVSSGCGTSALYQGNIYYQESFSTVISKYEPLSETFIGNKSFDLSFYALSFDEINGLIYTSETDYFSYGKINVYSAEGIWQTSFDAGVSPGNIAFDMRTATAVHDAPVQSVRVSPNPASDLIQIHTTAPIDAMQITDMRGNILDVITNVYAGDLQYNISALSPGNYFISITTADGPAHTIISKL